MNLADTIVAVSSAAGDSARMIVRAAGPHAFSLLARVTGVAVVEPGSARRLTLAFDGVVCPAWVYAFAGPRSYTGDDLVEFHLPGNPLLARLLLDDLIAAGARTAGPGEFTARAFLNGRLDLSAAEGVALTIAATHADELRAARRLLAGELARRLRGPIDALADVLALLEANIDFAEEDIAFVTSEDAQGRLAAVAADLRALDAGAGRFERLAGGAAFALVGLPNAGKSTLLNAMAGTKRAVVSPVAGTTRDVVTIDLPLARGLVRVLDTAGVESVEAGDSPAAAIADQVQQQARRAADEADFLIDVRDLGSDARAWLPRPADVIVFTKADLYPVEAARHQTKAASSPSPLDGEDGVEGSSVGLRNVTLEPLPPPPPSRRGGEERAPAVVTAFGGDDSSDRPSSTFGLASLLAIMDALAFGRERGGDLALTARQAAAIADAVAALDRAGDADAVEIAAAEVRAAIDALGAVLGRVTPDDVLGRIFASCCVGK